MRTFVLMLALSAVTPHRVGAQTLDCIALDSVMHSLLWYENDLDHPVIRGELISKEAQAADVYYEGGIITDSLAKYMATVNIVREKQAFLLNHTGLDILGLPSGFSFRREQEGRGCCLQEYEGAV